MSGIVGESTSVKSGIVGGSPTEISTTLGTGWTNSVRRTWVRDGTCFLYVSIYHTAGDPSHNETVLSIDSPAYYPVQDAIFPTVGYQGDLANQIYLLESNGEFRILNPHNEADGYFYLNINGVFQFR